MDRQCQIVAAWKEKLTLRQSVDAARTILGMTDGMDWPFKIALAPNPFCYAAVAETIRGRHLRLCAQNG